LLEKEYALGGLGTLGLIVAYLPLCDGNGTQMIGGIGEELLRAAVRFGPGEIPACWQNGGDDAAKKQQRYELTYAPAPMMIAMERLLTDAGVEILFDCRFADACKAAADRGDPLRNEGGRLAFACKDCGRRNGRRGRLLRRRRAHLRAAGQRMRVVVLFLRRHNA
jgi:hypothetical protein